MAKQLQPKSTSRNTQTRQLRLDMLSHGWWPIPCEGKSNVLFNWPKVVITPDKIVEWDTPGTRDRHLIGTGVRLEGDIFVIDVDVSIPEVFEALMMRLRSRFPCLAGALERSSGGVKRAFFLRISKPFKQRRTRRYTAERELLKQLVVGLTDAERKALKKTLNGQLVETFGGAAVRYFAWTGPHSPGREYGPVDPARAPWNVDLDSLPVFEHDDVGELIDICNDELAKHLAVIPDSDQQPHGTRYDLEPGMTFILKDGEAEALTALEERLLPGAENGVRGCMTWRDWDMSDSKANCNAFVGPRSHRLMIESFQDDVLHHWKDEEQQKVELSDRTREVLGRLADNDASLPPPPPPPTTPFDEDEPAPDADPTDVLNFLIRNYAVDRHAGMIADLRATDIAKALMDVPTFHLIYGAFRLPVEPPPRGDGTPGRGRPTMTPVTRIFLVDPRHITVDGTRFRPDRGFPTYKEGVKLYKNVWCKPQHKGDCDISWMIGTFFPIFMPELVEREWYLDVTAHRWVQPAIPGPSVIFVAHGAVSAIGSDYGTGRSGWFDFQAKLWGRAYVRNEDFSVVVGQNRQGDFTSWKAFKRLVTIDEAKTTPEQTTMKGGHSTYELLKTMVDPSPRWRTFKVKYGKPFEEFDYAPMDIASNHQGAVAVPPGDRRFGVVNNGRPLTEAEAERLYAIVNDPGAPAAFARWCEARDLSRFKPYAPPPIFAGKARMQALSETELDVIFMEMSKQFGRLFTKSQARDYAAGHMETPPASYDTQFDKRFEAAFRHYCTALRDQSKADGADVRVYRPRKDIAGFEGLRGEPKRERAYTFEARKVALLALLKPRERDMEVAKSETVVHLKHPFSVIDGGKGERGPDDRDKGQNEGQE